MSENGKQRRSIPERSMETSLLVDFLSAATCLVTDDQLSKACGADVRKEAHSNLQSARKIVLSEQGRWWKRIRGVGYEPSIPSDAPALGRYSIGRIHRESRRSLKRIGGCGDLSKLTNEERIRADAVASALSALGQFTQTATVKRLEAACQQKADKLLLGETLKQFGVE